MQRSRSADRGRRVRFVSLLKTIFAISKWNIFWVSRHIRVWMVTFLELLDETLGYADLLLLHGLLLFRLDLVRLFVTFRRFIL